MTINDAPGPAVRAWEARYGRAPNQRELLHITQAVTMPTRKPKARSSDLDKDGVPAVSMEGAEDASFWSSKASSYLRGLFHAAALTRGDMRLLAHWALSNAEPAEAILLQAGAGQWAHELAELRGEAQRTAATIRMVISRVMAASLAVDPFSEPWRSRFARDS